MRRALGVLILSSLFCWKLWGQGFELSDWPSREEILALEEHLDQHFGLKRRIVFVAAGGELTEETQREAEALGQALATKGAVVAVGADYGPMHHVLRGAKAQHGATLIFDIRGKYKVQNSELADFQILSTHRARQNLVESFADEMIVLSGKLGTTAEMIGWLDRLYTDPAFRKPLTVVNTELVSSTRAEVLEELWKGRFSEKPGSLVIMRDCAALLTRLRRTDL